MPRPAAAGSAPSPPLSSAPARTALACACDEGAGDGERLLSRRRRHNPPQMPLLRIGQGQGGLGRQMGICQQADMELQAADKTWSWFIMNDSYANLARLRLRGVILITSFGGDGSGCFRGRFRLLAAPRKKI